MTTYPVRYVYDCEEQRVLETILKDKFPVKFEHTSCEATASKKEEKFELITLIIIASIDEIPIKEKKWSKNPTKGPVYPKNGNYWVRKQ